jgi:hypothetical protein
VQWLHLSYRGRIFLKRGGIQRQGHIYAEESKLKIVIRSTRSVRLIEMHHKMIGERILA